MPHRVDTKYLPLHFKPPQQHLYNGLAISAYYDIFAREWTRPPAGKTILAQEWTHLQGQHACLRASRLVHRASECWHRTDHGTDKVKT